MRRFPLTLLLALVAFVAWGHPSPTSAVVLRMRGTTIDAELTLPVVELKLGWDKPFPFNNATAVVRDYGPALRKYICSHVRPVSPDGRAWTVSVGALTPVLQQVQDVKVDLTLTPPPGAPADKLTLNYDVIFHHLITHEAIVTLQSDWHNGLLGDKPVILATMRDTNPSILIDRSQGSWAQGFLATFRLGVRHIAEGMDHLLFLLALLLPSPLLAMPAARRWGGYAGGKEAFRRIAKVVTAFTIGHSATLVLGALGWVHLPSAVIESAIALSIFVSAVHAFRPIFCGREVIIAASFGLVHGLAFAETLTGFGFNTVTLVSSILGFNLGIEAFQLVVVLVTMPSLVLLAGTAVYPRFRALGAIVTGVAAACWFFERAFGWPNPVGLWVERAAGFAPWMVAGLALFALLARWGASSRSEAVAA